MTLWHHFLFFCLFKLHTSYNDIQSCLNSSHQIVLKPLQKIGYELNPGVYKCSNIRATMVLNKEIDLRDCLRHQDQTGYDLDKTLKPRSRWLELPSSRYHIKIIIRLKMMVLKPEDVGEGWMEIHPQVPMVENVNRYFDYFVTQLDG